MNADLLKLMGQPYDYRWLVVHERGFYLTPPDASEVEGGKDIYMKFLSDYEEVKNERGTCRSNYNQD